MPYQALGGFGLERTLRLSLAKKDVTPKLLAQRSPSGPGISYFSYIMSEPHVTFVDRYVRLPSTFARMILLRRFAWRLTLTRRARPYPRSA